MKEPDHDDLPPLWLMVLVPVALLVASLAAISTMLDWLFPSMWSGLGGR